MKTATRLAPKKSKTAWTPCWPTCAWTTCTLTSSVLSLVIEAMIASTTRLNTPGAKLAGRDGVHAVTDVTGFGLLGHALEMARGEVVDAGTLLGYVGDTGNAKGTPPHLHWGVYGTDGARNPLPLLR